ncbi:3'-5' exonuclease [Pseudomonas luteola]|uniref:3'-5' exonuclease n=1 Tax=Pseudomonas luteola TaxID=47886 RepID=UPI0028A01B15|nr:3'-5' exonuclease [Pseudomonas luteola]
MRDKNRGVSFNMQKHNICIMGIPFMSITHILCVDLEATCDEGDAGQAFIPLMETIELGAVMLDIRTAQPTGEFATFIRPQVAPVLSPFCKRLTHIEQANVDRAPTYPEVASPLGQFLDHYGNRWLWCSWGNYDNQQLIKDAARLNTDPLLPPDRHINLKKPFAKYKKMKMVGLKRAVEMLGLEWEGQHHRGIDDARNLARIVAHMIKEDVFPLPSA